MRITLSLLLALTFLVPPAPAEAATKKAVVPDPIKDATVNLYCRLKAGKTIYSPSGSGVFISDKGVILTNAHVAQYFLLAQEKGRVTGSCSVRTGSPAKQTYTADILYIPPAWVSVNIGQIAEKTPRGTGENDFALLYVTGAKKQKMLPVAFPALPLATTTPVAEGAAVTVTGYPTDGLDFKNVQNRLQLALASSTVSNVQSFGIGYASDILTLTNDTNAGRGISGGPVVSKEGQVAGIVHAKSNASLRAITASYIDRTLHLQTGLPLASLLKESFSARAGITKLLLPQGAVEDLAKGLRDKE